MVIMDYERMIDALQARFGEEVRYRAEIRPFTRSGELRDLARTKPPEEQWLCKFYIYGKNLHITHVVYFDYFEGTLVSEETYIPRKIESKEKS